MTDIAKRIIYLIKKFLKEELNSQEQIELESWIAQSEGNRSFFEKLTHSDYLFNAVNESDAEKRSLQKILQQIKEEEGSEAKVVPFKKFRWSAAAAIILLVAGVTYFLTTNRKPDTVAQTQPKSSINDKAPGKNGAILKLASGQEIILDNAANGNLTQQGSAAVTKQGNLLAYKNAGSGTKEVLYNTLRTPVGRQFQIILPDGTKAWLNSASSITYPTAFTGKERNVTVSGEVYMEVAKDAAKPFKAHVIFAVSGMGETIVEVLGTHFNMNAYEEEEEVATTLLEGKVRVTQSKLGKISSVLLQPGEQAVAKSKENLRLNKEVNIQEVMAWKDGRFFFNNTDLATIMRQISRWYDVEIVYEGKVPQFKINGAASRNSTLTELLTMIGATDVKFKVVGNKVIIPEQ